MAQKQRIYFDIDDTLLKATEDDGSKSPLMMPAWDRLGYACNKVLGKPPAIDWTHYKGSTDFDVVSKIVSDVLGRPDQKITMQIINEMDDYYAKHGIKDISSLVFPDTARGLENLTRQGYELGVVTGNSLPTAIKKLEDSKLINFFPNRELWFTGGDSKHPTRAELLYEAHKKNIHDYLSEQGIQPVVYVADSEGDLDAVALTTLCKDRGGLLDMDSIEFRLLLRTRPNSQPLADNIYKHFQNHNESPFFKIGDELFSNMLKREWKHSKIEAVRPGSMERRQM